MKLRIFALIILLGSFVQVKCQSIKFKEIQFASFDVNSYRTNVKDSVFIALYCSINSTGLIKIYNPEDLQDSPKVFYSYQLSPTDLEKISSTFNLTKPLKSYLIKTKLEKNSMYAGSYEFYRISYLNNTVDSICLIPPFVSTAFRKIEEFFSDIFYSGKGRSKINHFAVPNNFLVSLKLSYVGSKYLPEIKNLPPFILEKQN